MTAAARRLPRGLLAALCLLPTVQVLVSVFWQIRPTITYPALKLLMLAAPVVVWWWGRGGGVAVAERVGWKRPNPRIALGSGLAMAAVVLLGYYGLLAGRIDPGPVAAKVQSLGLLRWYWAMAMVISLGNALLEEYYWRAFIVGELRRWIGHVGVLTVLGGGLFALHHVFLLAGLFQWPLVMLGVAGTAAAGAVWTFMRLRGCSILDCYISHVLADLAVMWVGWDLIRSVR